MPAKHKKILILNGANLNLLSRREPDIYGSETLADICTLRKKKAAELGLVADCFQSNHEGELVTRIQECRETHAGIIVNAGAYTHTSVAIRDALIASDLPVIEVHLSNIFKREEFRHYSYISDIAKGIICGLGSQGYVLALQAITRWVR